MCHRQNTAYTQTNAKCLLSNHHREKKQMDHHEDRGHREEPENNTIMVSRYQDRSTHLV